MSAVTDRDGNRCVGCDTPSPQARLNEHHRIPGRRSDNRPSNKLTLCGSGTTGCHGRTHNVWPSRPDSGPRWARTVGWLVSRYGLGQATGMTPVWYNQPSLARVGWYLLDDHGNLTPTEGADPCV